jgi:putative two-component system response regulator
MHILRAHPEVGARLLDGSDLPVLQMARDIALSHHERCNGSGYPQGLSGPQVPESARLVAIADVYDALVSDRVYRPAFPEDVALAMMHEGRGRQFDPVVLDRFVELLPSVKVLREGMRNGHPSLPSLLVAAG